MPEIKKKYVDDEEGKCASVEIDESILGLNQFHTLNDFVESEMTAGIKSFIFDLSGLNSINSSGLGILISCLKKIKSSNGSLRITNANEKIMNIFKLTKLNNVFEF